VTDRRTDRRADRQTEFSSLYRVCIPCSAVKINAKVESERTDLDVAAMVDKKVLRLEITVEDLQVMKILERQHHLGTVETSVCLTRDTHTVTDRETDRHSDRQTDRQTDRQKDRQIDRQTDRQTDIQRETE